MHFIFHVMGYLETLWVTWSLFFNSERLQQQSDGCCVVRQGSTLLVSVCLKQHYATFNADELVLSQYFFCIVENCVNILYASKKQVL